MGNSFNVGVGLGGGAVTRESSTERGSGVLRTCRASPGVAYEAPAVTSPSAHLAAPASRSVSPELNSGSTHSPPSVRRVDELKSQAPLLLSGRNQNHSWEERKPGGGALVLDKMQLCC